MIIVIGPEGTEEDLEAVISEVQGLGYDTHVIRGVERRVVACVGHEDKTPLQHIAAMRGVEQAIPILKPFKLASTEFRPEPTVIDIDGIEIGGREIVVIAGPCSVESAEQLMTAAREAKKFGAKFLRGGAFKPRTSPYAFQGLGAEGPSKAGRNSS